MVTKEQVVEALEGIVDPFIHKTLKETNAIKEVTVKPEKEHVSVKIAIVKTGTAEQMQLQSGIVKLVKELGATTVGLRFAEFTEEELAQFAPPQEEEKSESLLSPNSNTTFLAVASGKGGVGKSTVSVNLAIALARLGKKVGIIDADIYGFSVPDMMGIEKRPIVRGDKIIPVERLGVKVISMGFFVKITHLLFGEDRCLGKC